MEEKWKNREGRENMAERKLTPGQIEEAREKRLAGASIKQLSGQYGVSAKTMRNYCEGITPAHHEEAEGGKSVPDVVADFESLLKDHGIGKGRIIAKWIADTGEPGVFEDAEDLNDKLSRWPREVTPTARANVLDHWCRPRGIPVPPDLLKRAQDEALPEAASSMSKGPPRSFVVINNEIKNLGYYDPSAFTFAEAVMKVEAEKPSQSKGGGEWERLRGEIAELRENRFTAMFNALSQRLDQLEDRRPAGRSEFDVISQFITELSGTFRTELPLLRSDLKQVLAAPRVPEPKTPAELEARRGKYREALARDERISQLMHELYFSEGPEAAPKAAVRQSAPKPAMPPTTYE